MEEKEKEKEKANEDPIQATSNEPSEEEKLSKKNLETNKDKVLLFDFLLTVTKMDFCFEKLQGYLYWVGLMEFFFWFMLLGLFFVEFRYMAKIFFFVFHIPRGIIGLIILYYLPKTYEVINGLENMEANTLDEIKEKISANYIKTLSAKKAILKPLLIAYFVLTMITIIVDIVMFCVITPDFGLEKIPGQLFSVLLIANVSLIVGDFLYILFLTGSKYFFPPSQNEAIHKAVIGFFTQLKVGIATGFTKMAKKMTKKKSKSNANNNDPRSSDINGIADNQTNNEGNKDIVKEDISIQVKDIISDDHNNDMIINNQSDLIEEEANPNQNDNENINGKII